MEFSVWNAVTLGVVVFVLLFYRQLDSKNRSLEKVKRFADKAMDQFSALVEERSRDVKDLAIELDVNVKTGREALKRVREVEQGLHDKAAAIETIERRITGYDQVLGELAGMTARVDENLRRIHEESEFVDRVGHSISEASAQLERIQKRVPEVEREMREQNAAGIEGLRVQTERRMDEQLETVLSRAQDVERRIQDFSAYMVRLEARREEAERESLARARSALEACELELSGTVEQTTRRVEEQAASAELDVLGRMDKRMSGFQGELEKAHEKAREQADLIERLGVHGEAVERERLERLVKAADACDARLAATAEATLLHVDEQLTSAELDVIGRTDKRLGDNRVEIEERVSRMRALAAEIEQLGARRATEEREVLEKIRAAKESTVAELSAAGEATTRGVGETLAGMEAQAVARMQVCLQGYLGELEGQTARVAEMSAAVERLDLGVRASEKATLDRMRQTTEAYEGRLAGGAEAAVGRLTEHAAATEALTLGRMEKRLAEYLGDIEGQAVKVNELDAAVARREEAVRASEQAGLERMRQTAQTYEGRLTEIAAGAAGRVQEQAAATETLTLGRMEKRLGQYLGDLEARAATVEEMRASIERLMASVTASEDESLERMRQTAATCDTQLAERAERAAGRVEERAAAAETQALGRLEKRFGEYLGDLEGQAAAVEEMRTSVERQVANLKASEGESLERMRQVAATCDTQLAEAVEGLLRRLDEQTTSAESGVLARMEKRLTSYEGELDYRFRKMSEVGADIEAMEQNLRGLMAAVETRVREEFGAYAKNMEEERAAERSRTQQEIESFWARHREIEQGLADLRSKAYQDVSQKLKGFEEEFFADLGRRGEDLDVRLSQWQGGLEERLRSLARQAQQERKAVEERYGAELAAGLDALKRGAVDDQKRVEQQVVAFDAEIRKAVGAAEDRIRGLGESLQVDVERIRGEAMDVFRGRAEELKAAVGADMERTSRETAQALTRQRAEIQTAHEEIDALLVATRAEATAGQTRVSQQLKEHEADAKERIEHLRDEMTVALVTLRDDFAAQRDELIVGTNEERLRLRNEIEAVSAGTRDLQVELTKRSEAALAALRRDQESFEIDYRRKSNEFATEVEKRHRAFRALLDGVRDKSETLQAKLFGKIEEGYGQLSASFDDMDKRLKGFVAQTRVFERADGLRLALEGSVEALKTEIAGLQPQRKEIHDLETQLVQTRRLAEDVTQKLTKFTAERRRIDDMDNDFRKLLSVSREVDLKLQTVTTSHDALDQIQARIRSLEDLEQTVEARYERLEKRKAIIDSTSNGVQKNLQTLELLETNLAAVRPQVQGFAEELVAMRNTVGFIEANREKTDAVVARISEMDGILHTLEERIGKLQTAREWLARAETRLEEVGKQAQDQLRLLETLVKADLPKGRKEQGAPARDARETVVKLKRQGWSAAEISRVTHLSLGEVELILELAPKAAT
jgi:chromosome segregation ATPase